MIGLILAAAILSGVFIRWAALNDNLAALEALDDEALAVEAAAQWECSK